jgi:hypothetical protein
MITKRAFAPKIKTKILTRWKKLSENDIESLSGRLNLLSDKIQKIYNCSTEQAIMECNEFKNSNKLL